VLVSPCRNEATSIRRTLDSVAAQTRPPDLWVVVDDGSTDETPAILEEYARRLPFLRIRRREDRGRRSVGPGVIEAFYAGLDTVDLDRFEYLCKLDMDLDLPPTYFQTLIERMEAEPRLGTCSGKPYYVHPRTGAMVSEGCGDETSIGASKFYRVRCFKDIGGFVRAVMWDGIDCHRCRMKGWIACSWDEPLLRFIHLRPMGSSDAGILKGRRRHGYGQYFMGTGFVYVTLSAIVRLRRPPIILGGLAMWWGYVWSWITRKPRYEDREFRRFLRRFQWSCLLHGKAGATRRTNERQAARWAGTPSGGA
jgi:glycosyltransferase involved in cell wall biosynthesis